MDLAKESENASTEPELRFAIEDVDNALAIVTGRFAPTPGQMARQKSVHPTSCKSRRPAGAPEGRLP